MMSSSSRAALRAESSNTTALMLSRNQSQTIREKEPRVRSCRSAETDLGLQLQTCWHWVHEDIHQQLHDVMKFCGGVRAAGVGSRCVINIDRRNIEADLNTCRCVAFDRCCLCLFVSVRSCLHLCVNENVRTAAAPDILTTFWWIDQNLRLHQSKVCVNESTMRSQTINSIAAQTTWDTERKRRRRRPGHWSDRGPGHKNDEDDDDDEGSSQGNSVDSRTGTSCWFDLNNSGFNLNSVWWTISLIMGRTPRDRRLVHALLQGHKLISH